MKQNSNLTALDIDWKCLKYLLEFIQYQLNYNEDNECQMDCSDSTATKEPTDDHYFVTLIPYMFSVLETVETAFVLTQKSEIEIKLNILRLIKFKRRKTVKKTKKIN